MCRVEYQSLKLLTLAKRSVPPSPAPCPSRSVHYAFMAIEWYFFRESLLYLKNVQV